MNSLNSYSNEHNSYKYFNTDIIGKLQKSNFSLTKNVISLTNDLVNSNAENIKLNKKYLESNNTKNLLIKENKNLSSENDSYSTKILMLETEIEKQKYDIYSRDLTIKSLKESFEINCESKNILIRQYIDKNIKDEIELSTIKTDLEKSQKYSNCVICYKNKKDILLEPCNHLCLCNDCSKELIIHNNRCPICRELISNSKKIYF